MFSYTCQSWPFQTLFFAFPLLRDGWEHLESQGSIQDKITVCATDDSYQMTRERMSQVEKDIMSRSAIEIKPGSTSLSEYRTPTPLCTGPVFCLPLFLCASLKLIFCLN